MKKLYLIAFAFCAVAIAALFLMPDGTDNPVAQNSPSATKHDPSVSSELANTFLWKLEKNGGPTSYLLGTLHLGKINDELSEPVMNALSETSALVTESNVMPEGQELFEIGMMMMDLQGSLSQKLGQERFNRLVDLVGPVTTASGLEKMQPWAALTLVIYNKPDGYSEQFGVDMLLTKKAIEYNKRRIFLEPIKDSLKLFSDLPQDKIISLMDISINYSREAQEDTEQLIDFYRSNQINEVAALLTDKENILKYYPEGEKEFWYQWFNQDLLIKRNDNWLPLLKQQLEVEPTLVAVGALHLIGDDGLIRQFQNMGYTVTPVMPD